MLNSKSSKMSTLEFKGHITHSQCSLDRLSIVELNIGHSLASSTSGISDDSDISDFSTVVFDEKVPDIFFFSFER